MSSQKVSVVMATYNGLDYLRQCLPSLFRSSFKNFELILIDNNSKDGTEKFIKEKYPQVRYIRKDKNYGFAGGNNFGLKYITGEYVLFLSNDTKVEKNFMQKLVDELDGDKSLGGVQSKVFLMDQPELLDAVGIYLTSTGFMYEKGSHQHDSRKYNKKSYVYSAKGVCMMFRSEVIKKILVDGEIFDSRYFAYFEETDLCHRVWLAGYKILYVPESVIYHKAGGTSKKMNYAFIQYHSYKNRLNSLLKNLSMKNIIKILPSHLIICEINAVIYLLKAKPDMFLAINKAFYWNIVSLNSTLRKRYFVQHKIRNVRDEDFFGFILKDLGFGYYFSKIFSK